jgi:NADPH-dependent 2,4-dienoyl-CoA reductase/sulfur reductase-like enzyme
MKAVIIGGVAAGMSAAAKIKRTDPTAEVTVYEKGRFLSYGACGLPYFVGGDNDDYTKLIARSREDFELMGVRALLLHEAVGVDPLRKTVAVRDLGTGAEFEDGYDALLVATGCGAVLPPVPGADGAGVFTFRGMEDGLLMRGLVERDEVRRCAVVGGGYVGVEMAEAFLKQGKEVTLIEKADRLLLPFEPEMSEIAAMELTRNGASVRTGEEVLSIGQGGGGSSRLVRTGGGVYEADVVLLAAGIMPATGFLRDTGIRMGKNGAIIVDREMRSSIPDIYAAGDCAVTWNRATGEDYFLPLGTVANKCGRIAGGNMLGARDKFAGALGTAAVKVCDVEMARTGVSEADARRLGLDYASKLVTAHDRPPYYPGQSLLVIKLIYEKATLRLLGACAAGRKGAVLRVDVFAVAIHSGMTTKELGMVDLAYAPPFAGVWDAVHIAANAAK